MKSHKTVFLNFIPPWQIPSVMKACTCVMALEKESSPVFEYHTTSIPYEALATGRCVLLSDSLHRKEPYSSLKNGEEVLVVDPSNSDEIRKMLSTLIENPDIATNIGRTGYRSIMNHEHFNENVDKTIKLYKAILNK